MGPQGHDERISEARDRELKGGYTVARRIYALVDVRGYDDIQVQVQVSNSEGRVQKRQ